jgi:hypothetical protein
MPEAEAAFRPLIYCTPPTDPSFLAGVSRAYGEATAILSSEAAVFVGTLIRLRVHYPMASIVPLSMARPDPPCVVWLVSRDGWSDIESLPSPLERVARPSATASQAALPSA